MTRFLSPPVWSLVLAGILAGGLTAAEPTPGVRIPGGVADPANKVVYLTTPAGGVVALDIETGKQLWESKEATRPVAARGTNVYALAPVKGRANAFRVVTLDAGHKGEAVATSDPAALPDWADVGDVTDRLLGARTFHLLADLDGGTLRVRWAALAEKAAFGESSFDLATGKVATAPGKPLGVEEPKHSEAVMRVIRKRLWGSGTTAAAGDWVFSVIGKERDGAWVQTVEAADLKTGDKLWAREYHEDRPTKK